MTAKPQLRFSTYKIRVFFLVFSIYLAPDLCPNLVRCTRIKNIVLISRLKSSFLYLEVKGNLSFSYRKKKTTFWAQLIKESHAKNVCFSFFNPLKVKAKFTMGSVPNR